jgi:pimeloyl-ACP methyl ester carboxylesterase
MATFVLVHGAWHGGWCWRRLTPLLRAAPAASGYPVGHEVYVPTLTGLGERAHLLTPAVDLDTHTQDVLGVLEYEELQDVILVGHSYGGMVITAVAERAAERLAHLVYLDAFVPQDGQCLLDLFPVEAQAQTLARARAEGDGWRLPPQQEEEPFGVTDPADAQWLRSKLSPHPVKTFQQPVGQRNPEAASLPRTFINCTATGWFEEFAERARSEPGSHYRELPTGHDAMITAPTDLAQLLRELAEVRSAELVPPDR